MRVQRSLDIDCAGRSLIGCYATLFEKSGSRRTTISRNRSATASACWRAARQARADPSATSRPAMANQPLPLAADIRPPNQVPEGPFRRPTEKAERQYAVPARARQSAKGQGRPCARPPPDPSALTFLNWAQTGPQASAHEARGSRPATLYTGRVC